MRYDYYLIKNHEILQRFSDDETDGIKSSFDLCLSESDDFDYIEVWKVSSDVFIKNYSQVRRYGMNVTSEYLDEGDFFIL